ncbi:GAF domain-containing protein [Rhizobium sp. DKSPLA3]|uniref:histidine kinase n=1 Tax=Rhizobium quercicola TaxID=2901226 RepID=A0A9X1NQP1_9HYPH|nr:GAF domain-containing protein [Rhizobium quercicola]MCD7109397.1 GAF domain-containing protein [Rhizobium quercicola]
MASQFLRHPTPTPLARVMDAVSAISRARTVESLVESIRATARNLIGCEGIAIIRRDGEVCHYIEEDAIGALWKGQSFPAVACVSGWAMIHRQTVVIPDIARDDRIPYELYQGTFVRALMMAPIEPGQPVGAIGAYWAQPYAPSGWEIDILEALARAAATAYETIQLLSVKTASAHHLPTGSLSVDSLAKDVERIHDMDVIPKMLDVVVRMTGMGFAAVARVTEDRWIACQVLDPVGFGLKPGSELPIESTLCNEIRSHRQVVVFEDATQDPIYRDHHTPRIYGLRSYISVPIILANGQFWGTLCAIDPSPAKVNTVAIVEAFKIFAQLIAHQLEATEELAATAAALRHEQELAELREQFIAVLGHDLRNPIAALQAGTKRLLRDGWTDRSPVVLQLMQASTARMTNLVENIMDLARARLGEGLTIVRAHGDVAATLLHIVDELQVAHPEREFSVQIDKPTYLSADHARLAQLFSNLIGNALTHGTDKAPVRISGTITGNNIEFSVANAGDPIPAELIEKLFLPFQRGSSQQGSRGLGLGLFIASHIAKAHGGHIHVTSDENETCFTLRMPHIVHLEASKVVQNA